MNDQISPIVNEVRLQDESVIAARDMALANMEKIEAIKRDRKNAREMLAQLYIADEGFKKTEADLKKAKLDHDVTLKRLTKSQAVYDLKDKIKALTRQYNETKQAISDYLTLYETKTGQLSFFKLDGDEVRIVKSAKPAVIKKKWM